MLRSAAALVMSLAAIAGPFEAAQVPDMFTCIEPARVATGTFEYQNDSNLSRPRIPRHVSQIDAGGQRLVRLRWLTPLPSEQITDLEATSLTPLRTSFTATYASGTKASALLEIIDGEVRGKMTPASSPIAMPTGGRPVVLGPYVVEWLAAAVNWDRCPSVSTRTVTNEKLREVVLTRAGTTTFPLQGASIAAIELDVRREGPPAKVWVTQAAPHFPLKFTTSTSDNTFSLAARSQ